MTLDFDSPQTSTIRSINPTGTINAHYNGFLTLNLIVTNTSVAHPRDETFKRAFALSNNTFTPTSYHGTYNMTIVPRVYGTDTVTATWGVSSTSPDA